MIARRKSKPRQPGGLGRGVREAVSAFNQKQGVEPCPRYGSRNQSRICFPKPSGFGSVAGTRAGGWRYMGHLNEGANRTLPVCTTSMLVSPAPGPGGLCGFVPPLAATEFRASRLRRFNIRVGACAGQGADLNAIRCRAKNKAKTPTTTVPAFPVLH